MNLPSMRHSRTVLSAGALVAAALLALLTAWGAVGAIEGLSQAAVDKALLLDGSDGWAEVETDGLQVILTGVAPDETARFRALKAAGGEVDSSRVIDHMEVLAAQEITPPRFSIEMLRNEGGISMIGLIPAATDREALASRVGRIASDENVTDLLETADYAVPEGWDPALDYALKALEMLPRSKISIDANRVEVEAIADSAEQKKSWEQALSRSVPGALRVGLDISAPRPVITPFTLRFTMDDAGARFDACTAHTEEGRTKIVAAGLAAGVTGRPDCTIALGVPSPDWPDAVARGIAAVAELGGGSLTFSDADITLVAPVTTPEATYDKVVGELEADLPEVFSLHAVLPEPEPGAAGDEAGVPEFVATLATDGQVQLRGRVADEQERTIVESFARARFGMDKVYAAMRVDPNLPRGWSVRTLAGLEALSQLNNGTVLVQPAVVDITGATGDKGASAEISRILSEKLGEAEDFRVNVTYEERLDPVAALPSPSECVAAVNAAMADAKITFAPGSANIEASSAGTVDKIAEILKSCPDVSMEVGGYTDSQGREEMNKALSQRRADAVLSALLARRVLTSSLTAHGYGEENPIADNDTEEGREANRRIEFRLIGASAQAAGLSAAEAAGETAAPAEGTEAPDAAAPDTTTEAATDAPKPRPDAATDAEAGTEPEAVATDAEAQPEADTTEPDATPTQEAEPPADDATATDTPAEATTEAEAATDTPTDTTEADAPVVVDPDLAGIRPKPRPAQ